MTQYQMPKNVRREAVSPVGRLRGGKLQPVHALIVEPSEGGLLDQTITIECDPIPGRLLSEILVEMTMVFVPTQAIDAIKDPDADYAGMTEVVRQKYLSGVLFPLENEGVISKACFIEPISIGGVKKVNEMYRIGYNAAINFLRLRKYSKAVKVLHTNTAITPALISKTVLDRLMGVLDPDDHINGLVQLELPTVNLPVKGLGFVGAPGATVSVNIRETGGTSAAVAGYNIEGVGSPAAAGEGYLAAKVASGSGATAVPDINALFSGVEAGGFSMTDMYAAQNMDRMTRQLRKIVDANPYYGEEMALRFAHGLSMDNGHIPWIIGQRMEVFGKRLVGAMDTAGVNDDTMRTDASHTISIVVPIPRTELGGVIYTLLSIKPDEIIANQPHPIGTRPFGARNFMADELALDPVPVYLRDIDSKCGAGNEATIAMYTGHNQLVQTYVHYGFNGNIDLETVENKTSLWQLAIPMSVTPSNILYPSDIPHHVFPGPDTPVYEPFTYNMRSIARIPTPIIIGPTPVEELAIIETGDIFGEADE